jgi:2-keto-4-pentenoate hydratase
MTRATVAAPGQDALPHDQLVGLLMRARHDRSPVRMPDGFAARISPAQGYEVQRLHTQAMLARYGGCVIGTKLGGRDMAAVAALGLSGPFQGPIFSTFTHDSPAQLRRDGFFLCAVEAEIGVLIGEDIGGHPHLPERDVLVHAIQAVIPSIEIADTRYADYEQCPAAAILADLGFAGGWVRGAAVADWKDIDLPKLAVRLLSNGVEVRSGSGAQAMGDPLHALSLLVADLGRDGRKLCAGQVVSTGSCTTAYLAKAGESLVADFGSLGQVSVAFT